MEKELSDVRESKKAETENLAADRQLLKLSLQKQEANMEALKEEKMVLEREVADMNKLRAAKDELAQQLKVRGNRVLCLNSFFIGNASIGCRSFRLEFLICSKNSSLITLFLFIKDVQQRAKDEARDTDKKMNNMMADWKKNEKKMSLEKKKRNSGNKKNWRGKNVKEKRRKLKRQKSWKRPEWQRNVKKRSNEN